MQTAPTIIATHWNVSLKYSKYAGFIGPTGDVISLAGALGNLYQKKSLEHNLDLGVAIIGFYPVYGDGAALVYMGGKWWVNDVHKRIRNSSDGGAEVIRGLELLNMIN